MWSIRKIHKYVAMVLGAVFFAWIVSGSMMVLPQPTPKALESRERRAQDYSAATLSPADAIERLKELRGPDVTVNRITIRPLMDRLIYEITARRQPVSLFDAGTGEIVEITPELADRIARQYLRKDVGESSVEFIDRYNTTYPWGPLPIYRLQFASGQGTIAYVTQSNGSVSFTDRRKQVWNLITSVHNFGVLKFVFRNNSVGRSLLLLASAISLIIVFTGYFMVFFPRAGSRGKNSRGTERRPNT